MDFKQRAKELVAQMTLAEKMAQMQYESPAIERLGIPAYNWWNEALHGAARTGTATVFPQSIAMAASFDDELMETVGGVISDEVRAKYNQYRTFGDTEVYQGLTCWSPNINIFRDPRWGRGHETYGEDPMLTAKMGAAFVRGMQGYDPVYRKVDATLKHYAVHSGPESERHHFDAVVSEKDLYETYLFAFKYCIDHAHPAAVMGAYNRVLGEPCCASKRLLGDILRGEFGFDGYVVSDCGAICDINKTHKVTANEAESAALAVKNGCDLNCGDAYKWLKTSVAMGLLDEETVTVSVERLFEARLKLGMFDKCVYDDIPYSIVACKKHKALARQMSRESIVLCKNDGILPLSPDKTYAVIGPNADDLTVLLANYNGTPDHYTTPLEGIQNIAENVIYARGTHTYKDEEHSRYFEHPLREAIIAARHSDVVILCMGINPWLEGEETPENESCGDKPDLELPAVQKRLFEEIIKVGKPMVFVNISGSCLNLSRADETCNAVVQCFYPGAEGGDALAEILFGKYSPCGRLPVTFYRSTDDLPPFNDYDMENRTYRFFKGSPLYPFGHGLTYGEIKEDWKDENAVVLKNNGKFGTKYAVLKYADATKRKLVDFKKIFVPAGGSITVKF
ncbi:MAG TPA: glycoside hydrolase family 3 C-terminal domain-containing protein [Oscillospiraceae bacterium]|nr:glycoside hydrolase family 3 C-terminal domain-containing protein [Oscillospiraceae bacterium]HPF56028.1 glycoside hydrolase family 3 C-terminal domain-containing protein [Clostridiales bacterium]HPK35518.1 glycoside hydrolase family 3 C-terminal domain-containing protein [Oscillospiraceae bacterium]HPR75653.1 glycoside hydrolase family 3 C-terminal domain-containing protein [Oscillospiraceae bacterium]